MQESQWHTPQRGKKESFPVRKGLQTSSNPSRQQRWHGASTGEEGRRGAGYMMHVDVSMSIAFSLSVSASLSPSLSRSAFLSSPDSRIEVEQGLGEISRKHRRSVVDRLGQLAKLSLVDGSAVVRVVLPKQD